MVDARALIERAKLYPFTQPTCSHVFTHEGEIGFGGPVGPWDPGAALEGVASFEALCESLGLPPSYATEPRLGIFGYGSNPSAETLRRKFSGVEVAIPVIRAELDGFDAVYSAHVFGGFVPAALQASPGTTLAGCILYLTAAELEVMNASESLGENYVLAEISGVRAGFESGATERTIQTYLSTRGCLAIDGSCAALAGIEAGGRSFPALSKLEALEAAKQASGFGGALDDFILAAATDPGTARRLSDRLGREAIAFAWPRWRQIEP